MELSKIHTSEEKVLIATGADITISKDDAVFLFHGLRALTRGNIQDEHLKMLVGNMDRLLTPVLEEILVPHPHPDFLLNYGQEQKPEQPFPDDYASTGRGKSPIYQEKLKKWREAEDHRAELANRNDQSIADRS